MIMVTECNAKQMCSLLMQIDDSGIERPTAFQASECFDVQRDASTGKKALRVVGDTLGLLIGVAGAIRAASHTLPLFCPYTCP